MNQTEYSKLYTEYSEIVLRQQRKNRIWLNILIAITIWIFSLGVITIVNHSKDTMKGTHY